MTVGRSRTTNGSDPPRTISPDLRREMQRRYNEAQAMMNRSRCDFGKVHNLLAQNLQVDPGNLRYIDLLLLNLRRRGEAGARPGLMNRLAGATPLGARAALKRSLVAHQSNQALALLGPALWEAGLSTEVLGLAASVCSDLQLGPAELRYRAAAVEASPTDPEQLRLMARALTRLGQFGDARDWWLKLKKAAGGDAEADAALASTEPGAIGGGEAELREQIAANPADVAALLSLAELRLAAADFDTARELLTQASAVGGGDLRVRDAWETLSLAQSEQRLKWAQEAAEKDPTESALQLVAQLTGEHKHLAMGIAHSRSERFPNDGAVKLDLVRRLKRGGNFSGAVQRLEELRKIRGFEKAALVELGECWQHLRQFEKGLKYYREAIKLPDGPQSSEFGPLALYRGAVLAEAMGGCDEALAWLEQLVATDTNYKDAGERLDKLRAICDKNGFSAG
jgi:tetratricopeptide (TPR) repeat protein